MRQASLQEGQRIGGIKRQIRKEGMREGTEDDVEGSVEGGSAEGGIVEGGIVEGGTVEGGTVEGGTVEEEEAGRIEGAVGTMGRAGDVAEELGREAEDRERHEGVWPRAPEGEKK